MYIYAIYTVFHIICCILYYMLYVYVYMYICMHYNRLRTAAKESPGPLSEIKTLCLKQSPAGSTGLRSDPCGSKKH